MWSVLKKRVNQRSKLARGWRIRNNNVAERSQGRQLSRTAFVHSQALAERFQQSGKMGHHIGYFSAGSSPKHGCGVCEVSGAGLFQTVTDNVQTTIHILCIGNF